MTMPEKSPALPYRRTLATALTLCLASVLGIIMWNLRGVNLTGSVTMTTINGQAVRYGSLAHGETVNMLASTRGIFLCPSSEPVNGSWANVATFAASGMRIYEYANGFPEKNMSLTGLARYPGDSFGISGKADTLTTLSAGKTYYIYTPTAFTFYCSGVVAASSSSSSDSSTSLTSTQGAIMRAADWNHDGQLSIFELLPVANATIGASNAGGTYDAAFDVNDSGVVNGTDALAMINMLNAPGLTTDPSSAFLEMYPLEEGNGTDIQGKSASNILAAVGGTAWVRQTSAPGNLFAMSFDGIDDRLTSANTANYAFTISSPFSVSAWVKPTAISDMTIMGKTEQQSGDPLSIKGWQMAYASQKYEFNLYASLGQSLRVRTVATFAPGTMHHVFVSYDGSGLVSGVKIYVDGLAATLDVVSNDLAGGDITTANAFGIAYRTVGGSPANLFQGTLDEIVILSAARTPDVIVREPAGTCGDGMCVGDEVNFCGADCFAGAVCGDGTCHPKEIGTCAADCGLPGACTDSDITPVWLTRGVISRSGTNPLFDYCDGNVLHQFNCASPDGDYLNSTLNCPSGCIQGVCR